MKAYSSPEIELLVIDAQDVIAASEGLGVGGEGTFDDEIEWT